MDWSVKYIETTTRPFKMNFESINVIVFNIVKTTSKDSKSFRLSPVRKFFVWANYQLYRLSVSHSSDKHSLLFLLTIFLPVSQIIPDFPWSDLILRSWFSTACNLYTYIKRWPNDSYEVEMSLEEEDIYIKKWHYHNWQTDFQYSILSLKSLLYECMNQFWWNSMTILEKPVALGLGVWGLIYFSNNILIQITLLINKAKYLQESWIHFLFFMTNMRNWWLHMAFGLLDYFALQFFQ